MAIYENQTDMFTKRAKASKENADRLYAQAMEAKERGDKEKYNQYISQSQVQYKKQKENEAKAIEHQGKSWR